MLHVSSKVEERWKVGRPLEHCLTSAGCKLGGEAGNPSPCTTSLALFPGLNCPSGLIAYSVHAE